MHAPCAYSVSTAWIATYTPWNPYSSNITCAIRCRFAFGFIGGSVSNTLRPFVSTRSFSSKV